MPSSALLEASTSSNRRAVTKFTLLGLTESVDLQSIVYVVFFCAYVVTLGGNLSIISTIFVEPKLHTLMYYFLGILSLLDIGCITVMVPPMLLCLLAHQCRVPYGSCLSKLFFFQLLAGVDRHLLTAMAYDRYLAICQPFSYSTHTSREVQGALVGTCCTVSFFNALTHTLAVSVLDFCCPNVITNFYCDLPPLCQLSFSSIHLSGQLLFVGATFMRVIPMILISVSYAHIAAVVLWICSTEGRKKAFSTCGSHLTVVCFFYGTGFFSYMRLGSISALDKDKGIAVFNAVFVLNPMLNPIIYSLWNPDVESALKRVLTGRKG
ncbi:olfactory receptor 3A10-like [Cavia porcellus]|uniref:olfactory receptor 3A10-like n=1 Tax=Cavia porcellus TaxID=10141 RepID=UPI002FE11497